MAAKAERKRSGKPTLRTIADLSGLAIPTVSRALNDAPDIGQATKEKVRQIAQQIGYVPNRAGVRLRTGKTNVISVIMSTQNDLTNHSGRFLTSFAEQLQGTRYHMNFTPCMASVDPMVPVRYLVENGMADCIILSQTTPYDPRVAYLMDRKIPFVTHGRTTWCTRHAYYDVDNRRIGRLGVEALASRNRKHIFAIAPPAQHAYGQAMRTGMTETARDLGLKLTFAQDVTSDSPRRNIVTAVADALRASPSVDAIQTGSSSAAMSSTAGLEAAGRRLGEDIDLFSKESAGPVLEFFRPQILIFSEDVAEAGEFCSHAARRQLEHPEEPPMQYLRIPTRDDIKESLT